VPETTKYTTRVYLATRGADTAAAGQSAIRVLSDFLARLRRTAPTVKGLRMEVEEPQPRKADEGVTEVWANLKAVVPHDLSVLGADNYKDSWRKILKETFNAACHHNHELVHHTSSRVSITREILPHEEDPTAEAAPVEQKPKEMIPVKVTLGGQEYNVEIPKGENLLDGVNDKGVAVKWDCKSGVCDTCKICVLDGMENLSAPNDREIEMLGDLIKQGYRLSCQVTANGTCSIKQ
jgi:ferredoxin